MSNRQILKTAKTLIGARKLIEDVKNWGRGSYNRNGQLCAVGAIAAVEGVGGVTAHGESGATDALRLACGDQKIAYFNDTHTHKEVLAVFDKAIAAEIEKSRGQ